MSLCIDVGLRVIGPVWLSLAVQKYMTAANDNIFYNGECLLAFAMAPSWIIELSRNLGRSNFSGLLPGHGKLWAARIRWFAVPLVQMDGAAKRTYGLLPEMFSDFIGMKSPRHSTAENSWAEQL